MTDAPRTGRAARRGLLITALLAGAVLVAGAAVSWQGARDVADALDRGQGELFVQALNQHASGPPDDAALQAVIEEQREAGLTFAALVRNGEVLRSAGEPVGPLSDLKPGLTRVAGRVQMVPRLPGPPPRRGELRQAGAPDGPPSADGPPRADRPPRARPPRGRPPVLVLEFEPRLSAALQTRATALLALAVLAALLLAGAAAIFWRQSLRADEAEAALLERERLAALGEMSAVLAHEIRNPLAALKGHAQLVAEQLADHRALRSANRVVQGAERLESLANDLLDFVRSGAVDLAPHDPVALLRSVAENHPGVAVLADATPDTWVFDRARMRQVLDNLLSNARQASEEVEAAVALEGQLLVFRIRDRGPGLPEGGPARLFEPFHTTKTRGVGLGLAVCKRIAVAHGGRIGAANREGGGAEFRVALPAREDAPTTTLTA